MNTLSAEKLKNLLEANRILSSTLDYHTLLRRMISLAAEVVDAETASVLLYDEEKKDLHFDVALSENEGALQTIRIPLGTGVAGWVARERVPQIVNDAPSNPHWLKTADQKTSFKTRSIIAVPLLFKDTLLGVVEAVNKKTGTFNNADLELFSAFAAQAAVAIENARLINGLKEEKEKMQTVFAQMTDGAVFVDMSGRSVLVNNAARQLLGNRHAPDASAGEQETLENIFSGYIATPAIKDIITSPEQLIPVEFARKGGKALLLAGLANRIFDGDAKPIGVLVIFRDMTAVKREEMVKRDFLSLISHKLKTPLVAITGYGPLLLGDSELGEKYKKIIASIHRQGMLLSSLVDKLLYYTMIESGTLTLALTRVNMNALVVRSLFELKAYLDERHAAVVVHPDVGLLPDLFIDGEKIGAVIRNFVENAVKFNGCAEKKVEITVRQERTDTGKMYGLSVLDNGPGIPPEERSKIFDKFYQIEESFTGQVEGAGLGLALVKQVVEAHGGVVGVENAPSGGSLFYFLLPSGRGDDQEALCQ